VVIDVTIRMHSECVGRVGCSFVARGQENERNPVNISLQGLLSSPDVIVLPEIIWRGVVTAVAALALVVRAMQDQVKNKEK
jgi:hypothetical protein